MSGVTRFEKTDYRYFDGALQERSLDSKPTVDDISRIPLEPKEREILGLQPDGKLGPKHLRQFQALITNGLKDPNRPVTAQEVVLAQAFLRGTRVFANTFETRNRLFWAMKNVTKPPAETASSPKAVVTEPVPLSAPRVPSPLPLVAAVPVPTPEPLKIPVKPTFIVPTVFQNLEGIGARAGGDVDKIRSNDKAKLEVSPQNDPTTTSKPKRRPSPKPQIELQERKVPTREWAVPLDKVTSLRRLVTDIDFIIYNPTLKDFRIKHPDVANDAVAARKTLSQLWTAAQRRGDLVLGPDQLAALNFLDCWIPDSRPKAREALDHWDGASHKILGSQEPQEALTLIPPNQKKNGLFLLSQAMLVWVAW